MASVFFNCWDNKLILTNVQNVPWRCQCWLEDVSYAQITAPQWNEKKNIYIYIFFLLVFLNNGLAPHLFALGASSLLHLIVLDTWDFPVSADALCVDLRLRRRTWTSWTPHTWHFTGWMQRRIRPSVKPSKTWGQFLELKPRLRTFHTFLPPPVVQVVHVTLKGFTRLVVPEFRWKSGTEMGPENRKVWFWRANLPYWNKNFTQVPLSDQ